MKTAISLEDSLMQHADEAARDLGMSRSGLIAEALRCYLRQREEARITDLLNRAHADQPSAEERRFIRKFKNKLPAQDRW